ncbi:MAG: carboxypeptidase regulatory-like domain-containing protein [Candidatus Sulfotelmatobacter sp.]
MRQKGAVVLLVVFLLAVAGYSQTFRGAINGTVIDQSGAVVANADVKATNIATAVTITATSTSDGAFSFQDLPLGTYKVTVTAPGFKTETVDNITVSAGGAYTLPVKLSVGGTGTTAVEVSAAALALDTTTATQNNVIPDEQVQNVPINGRDFTQFVALAPGYAGYSGAQAFGSLNGTRANQMNWQIDGVDNNDFWHNLAAVNQGGVSGIAGTLMPMDAIDEFAAQTQSNAEAGRNAGGVINVVLKSGSNQIHGSGYYFNRNTALGAATPFFNPEALAAADLPNGKPPLRNENYGFSLGGPIKKDRAFWFLSFEKQKYTIALSGLNTEPSTAYVTNAYALLAANGVPVSPISCDFLGAGLTSGLPAAACTPATATGLWPSYIDSLPGNPSNYFATNPSLGYSYNGVAKLDFNLSEKHHLSVRWFGGQGSQRAPVGGSAALATASSNLSYYFEHAPIHVFNYAVTLNSVLSPRLTNQVLVGVNYFNQVFRDAVASYDSHDTAQLFLSPDTPTTPKFFGAPNLRISGFEQVGITPPEGRNDITGMIADVLSYNTGKHQFRFGGEYRQAHLNEFYFFHSLGKFNFSGDQGPWAGSCADPNVCALADFLAGEVDNSSINVGNAERKIVVNALDFYGSDAWQVTRRLNLNLGLRWDYFGPLHNGSKDLAVFIPGQGIQIQGAGLDGIFHKNLKNFSPRVGFAYQPTSREDLVVRGGFGIYFDQINVNPFLDIRPPNNADGVQDNPAGPHPVSIYTQNTLGQTSYTWQPGQYIFNPVQLCPSGNAAIDPSCGTSVFDVYSVNPNFHTAYFFNYNLNVQKSFGNGAAIWQLGYVGSEGRHLSVLLNINQPVPDPNNPGQFILPYGQQYPNFGAIDQLNSIGTSNYNALQSTVRLRGWRGLSSQFGYTWSHNLDEISQYRGVIPFDSYNLKADYGNSDFDTRNAFTASLNWEIPGSSHGPRELTHGWAVSTVWSFHSGEPSDEIRQMLDIIGDPFAGVSHNFVKGATLQDFTGVQWINPAAFGPASCGQVTSDGRCYGTLRRNQIYGPGFKDVDLAVSKRFDITERVKFQIKAEMFNLFNTINYASGSGSINYSSGQITDTIGDFNGAPGLGPGEAFATVLSGKITF